MSLAHLGHAIRADKSSGRPLKTVWKTLTNAGVIFRQGELVLVGAGSGVGKSVFALTLALRSGAKTVYFSADSGVATQLSRAASMITGKSVNECMKAVERGYFFDTELEDAKHIRFEFDAGPNLTAIEESLDAYGYGYGEYPELIIVDNLLNVDPEDIGEGSHIAEESILRFLAELGKTRGCMVLVLTHLVGDYADGNKKPLLSSLRNKVDKIPNLVMTLWRLEETGQMGVYIPKNRGGEMGMEIDLDMDLSQMSITDPASLVNSKVPV